ncbi:MAG: calcium-binding protein, partial [Pseudorhodoplanes sp.]
MPGSNPTDILLSGGLVNEGAAAGTIVATLSTVDADVGDTFTYTITNDPSGFFTIVGNTIRVASGANIDFETLQQHTFDLNVTDSFGNTYFEAVTIQVLDLNEVTGTTGNDQGETQINGTIGADIIDALAGSDVVYGDAGGDTIYGREGNDNLHGGFGNDTIYGGDDSDSIYGESGADMLYGEGGNDTIYSGGGGGTVDGGDGNDVILAGTQGSDPFETLIGGAGDDTINYVGFGRADVVDAGSGSDTVYVYRAGGGGISSVTLGADSDTIKLVGFYAVNYGLQANITDFTTGADGDTVDLTDVLSYLTGYAGNNPFGTGFLQLVQDGADTLLQVDSNGATGGATFTTILRLENTTAASFTSENFTPAWPTDGSSPAGQTITGTTGNDQGETQINGTIGADIIDALAGSDVVYGDAGGDTIYG